MTHSLFEFRLRGASGKRQPRRWVLWPGLLETRLWLESLRSERQTPFRVGRADTGARARVLSVNRVTVFSAELSCVCFFSVSMAVTLHPVSHGPHSSRRLDFGLTCSPSDAQEEESGWLRRGHKPTPEPFNRHPTERSGAHYRFMAAGAAAGEGAAPRKRWTYLVSTSTAPTGARRLLVSPLLLCSATETLIFNSDPRL